MIKIPQILLTMALSKVRAHLVLCLLLALFVPTSLAWAEPYKQPSWKQNAKVGVELGFGLSYSLGLVLGNREKVEQLSPIVMVSKNPTWRFGLIAGYGFPFVHDTLAIGLDVGLCLSATRNSTFFVDNSLEEKYLHIPFALKLATFEKEGGVQETGLTLGYELNILLSSKRNPPSSGLSVANRAMLKRTEDMANSSKLGGSIFLGGKAELVAGCYLMGQIKFPITDFLSLKGAIQDSDYEKLHVYAARCLGSSLVELSLGFNLMKWL
jgi:hypothetical protein